MSNVTKEEGRKDHIIESLDDIMHTPPSWMVRAGSSLFLGIVIIFIFLSNIIKYPEIISCRISIISENIPAHILSKKDSRIESILFNDNSFIKSGDVIAVLESSANYKDYLQLQQMCNQFSQYGADSLSSIDKSLILGDMQGNYSNFIKASIDYSLFKEQDYYGKMISSVESEIVIKQDQIKNLNRESESIKKRVMIVKNQFKRDSLLFSRGVLSNLDYEKSLNNYLSVKEEQDKSLESLNRLSLDVIKARQTLLSLEKEMIELSERYSSTLHHSYEALITSMNEWSQANLLIAPIDGTLSFSKYWDVNQNVSLGDVVFSVIPDGLAQFKGRIFVPLAGAGKVKIGQKVNIKLDNYPYMEYGYVQSTIINKSRLPVLVDGINCYIVDVILPNSIVTNYNYEIDSDMEMYGTADIITENISIFKRVLMPFRYFTQKYIKD